MRRESLSVLLSLALAGCATMRSGGGVQAGASDAPEDKRRRPTVAAGIDVALSNRCARPIDVCYGQDSCITLAGGKSRTLYASTDGTGTVFIRLRGAPRGEFADATFSAIEIDESCTSLRRHLGR